MYSQGGKNYKYVPKKDIEIENLKSLNILKGCSQLKQVVVAMDVYRSLKDNNINISSEVYNELVRCCIFCDNLNLAS